MQMPGTPQSQVLISASPDSLILQALSFFICKMNWTVPVPLSSQEPQKDVAEHGGLQGEASMPSNISLVAAWQADVQVAQDGC